MFEPNLEEFVALHETELNSKLAIGSSKLIFQSSLFLNKFMEKRIEFFHRGYASCQLNGYAINDRCPNHVNDDREFDLNWAFENAYGSCESCAFCIHFIQNFLPSLKQD